MPDPEYEAQMGRGSCWAFLSYGVSLRKRGTRWTSSRIPVVSCVFVPAL